MALLDSMFLFEIAVEKLKSFVGNDKFVIKSEFTDIFSVVLKSPIEAEATNPKPKKTKNKAKVKYVKEAPTAGEVKTKSYKSQSVLLSSNIDRLMSHMLQYPMEISLWSTKSPKRRIGSTLIPWKSAFVEFLARLYKLEEPPPVFVTGVHNVFDEISSKRMASITLNITFTHMKDDVPMPLPASEDETKSFTEILSKPVKKHNANKKPSTPVYDTGTGVIKTFYSGGKRKKRTANTKRSIKKGKTVSNIKELNTKDLENKPPHKPSTDHVMLQNVNMKSRVYKSIVSLIKSDTDVDRFKQLDLVKTKSCSSIKRLNALNYVFGDRTGPFGSRIYTVGYFTVNTTVSKASVAATDSKNSGSSFESNKPKFKFKLCSSDCPSKKDSGRCADSECSLDLPADAADSITVTRCKDMKCLYKKDREPTDPRDDRIMMNLSSLKKPCCAAETVEEVVGSMKAKVQIGDHPCFCACECKFEFGKKTTYCKVCGGYESAGESIDGKPEYLMPPACPIYHNMTAKKPGSNSGSETKSRKGKSIEVPKEPKKGKKKRKDDRFKFNYGYKAPQIGHSQCAMPCTGTLQNVPKSMGWLWTADNIPALKVAQGWKPGAVSKCILRMLNRAKRRTSTVQNNILLKKSKTKDVVKPVLIVSKRQGQYNVEIQASEQGPSDHKPLIYKIASASNEDKIKRRERKERRLMKKVFEEFRDPYHPQLCEQTCYCAYKDAIGFFEDVPEVNKEVEPSTESSSSCDEGSDCSSLDVDWEIHFTPPIARHSVLKSGKALKVA